MKYWILSLFVFFYSFSAIAQTASLVGILKLNNGKPVADATIAIKGLNKYVLTGIDGKFEFVDMPYGKFEIEAFSLEMKKKTFHIELKSNSKPVTIEVEPSAIDLNEVVVSANSSKKEIEVKGFAVNVIETQKIAVQSLQTNELLDRTAGVRVRQDGGLGSQIKYNVNGLSGDAIKIFIDGVPASNFGSSFSLNSLPPALIERIEVYKGVVPGYLSEDALGGAINVILKQRRKKTLTTSYSLGSFNTHQWNMTGSHRLENGLTFDGSAFYNYSDNNYKVWGDDIYFTDPKTGVITESNGKKMRRFHDAYKSLGGKFNFGFTDVKWADQFLIGGILSKDYKEIQHGVTMRRVFGDRHTRGKSGVVNLSYHKKDFLLDGLSVKVDASHSYLKRQVIDTVGIMYDWAGPIKNADGSYARYTGGAELGNTQTAAINRDYSYMARANLSYRINDRHFLYANYLFNDFHRKIADQFQPLMLQKLRNTRDLQKNMLSFTYENLSFSDKLRTNIFYKHYFQKVTSNEPELKDKEVNVNKFRKNIDYSGYGLTFSYTLLPNLYLLGSAEKAIRLPNPNEMFGNVADGALPPSPGLDPERSFNANIGINYGYTIDNHSFGLNTSVYYRDTEGMIREKIIGGSYSYSQFENLEDVLTKGVDAELNYSYANKISFRFNISKFDVLFNTKYDEKGDPYNFYRMQVRNEPSFKFNSNITYFHNNLFLKNSKASVYYNISYVKGFLRDWGNVGSTDLHRIPNQFPMDLGLTYTFPKDKIVISFDAKNIFNEQVYDNYGLQKPGRSFYTKITYFIL